jgi:hypothetical protein
MINSDPATDQTDTAPQDAELNRILRSGAPGAIALAGIATAVVMLVWLAFYILVFVPRAGAP